MFAGSMFATSALNINWLLPDNQQSSKQNLCGSLFPPLHIQALHVYFWPANLQILIYRRRTSTVFSISSQWLFYTFFVQTQLLQFGQCSSIRFFKEVMQELGKQIFSKRRVFGVNICRASHLPWGLISHAH